MGETTTGTMNDSQTNYVRSALYGAHGELSSVKLANGLYDSTNFSPRLEVSDRMLGSLPGASDKWWQHNNYYPNSNVQNQTIVTGGLNVMQNYTYDTVNRLNCGILPIPNASFL
jgi:hypothetical protein